MIMNYITTTDLRTKSSQLVSDLKKGSKVSLIHRSKVVGVIEPVQEPLKTFDLKKFRKFVRGASITPLSYQEREKRYRKHLEEKYGKGFS
jgi:antitoxin (DNA-binding transcriptional repressor) of toxin-antitoxin stability system